MTQKKNRSSTASAKSNGSVASAEKKITNKKRMREEDSDEEIQETEKNLHRVKKLKQMLADAGERNKESDQEDSHEEEEIEVSDSENEDEDEYSESEDDDDDDEDDDDEDEDEDDSEHDGNTDEEFPEKVVLPKKDEQSVKKDKPKTHEKQIAEKKVKLQGHIAEPFKPSQANIMLFNIPRINEKELKGFLSKRNINPESVSCIPGPVALLGFSSEESAKKAVQTCSGATYNQGVLAAISAIGNDIALIKSNRNPHPTIGDAPLTCLFVTDLPKTVTEEDLVKASTIEPKHVRLITSGPKNRVTNASYIDCKSENDAKKALQALSEKSFDGKNIKVYLKPQFNFNPITENTVIVANVPFNVEVEDLKKEFPKAKKIELTRRGCFMLTFENAEIKEKVIRESKGKFMEGRELRFITTEKTSSDYAVFVSNIAFTATANQLKAAFPNCKNVYMKKNQAGKFNGQAVVYFTSKEDAEKAVHTGANKELNGRTLKLRLPGDENKSFQETPKKELKPDSAEESKVEKAKKPIQEGSDSDDNGDSDDDDDVNMAEEQSSDDDVSEQDDDGDEDDNSAANEGEEEEAVQTKKPKLDQNKTLQSPKHGAKPRGGNDSRGGNRGSNFRGGNRGNFRGGNRGGNSGGFRGSNRGRGNNGFRGSRGRGGGGGFNK